MGAITDLWKSERGLFAIALLAAVTAAMFVGKITPNQWLEQVQWISGFYISSKTLTSVIETVKSARTTPAPTPAPAPDPAKEPVAFVPNP